MICKMRKRVGGKDFSREVRDLILRMVSLPERFGAVERSPTSNSWAAPDEHGLVRGDKCTQGL
jgi:hypothetical protein